MSIFYQPTNIEQSTAAGNGSHEPSVSAAPFTLPSIGRIIEVSWVRDDTLRFDVDCIRQDRNRIRDDNYESHIAVYPRQLTHRLIHN